MYSNTIATMYPYILCFCGCALGDLYPAFSYMRARAFELAYHELGYVIAPEMLPFSERVDVDLSNIFDQLGIAMECCRTRMNTQEEIKNMY